MHTRARVEQAVWTVGCGGLGTATEFRIRLVMMYGGYGYGQQQQQQYPAQQQAYPPPPPPPPPVGWDAGVPQQPLVMGAAAAWDPSLAYMNAQYGPAFDMSMYAEYRTPDGSSYNYTQNAQSDSETDEEVDDAKAAEQVPKAVRGNRKAIVDMLCDAHFNFNNILATNILSSEYFKDLFQYRRFHEVLNEVRNKVTHLEALTIGQTRLPSTAFCLLYKLLTMKLTVRQMGAMLSDTKPPFMRGIALLYLRFVHPPKKLWAWFAPLLDDTTEFSPSGPSAPTCTLGEFAKRLLLDLNYPGTILPRIPIPVHREYKKLILTASGSYRTVEPVFDADDDDGASEAGVADSSDPMRIPVGTEVRAQYYNDGKYYDAVVEEVLPNGRYRVSFVDYDGEQAEVRSQSIKLMTDRRPPSVQSRRRERRGEGGSRMHAEKKVEEAIRRQERESALAHGKDYASRPASCKATMSINEHKRRRSRSPHERRREVVKRVAAPAPTTTAPAPAAPGPPRKADVSAKQAELLAKYGDASAR